MKAIQESGYPVYKIVHDTFHHHIGPDTFDNIQNDYDISYTGLVHISGVESNIPVKEYKDNKTVWLSFSYIITIIKQIYGKFLHTINSQNTICNFLIISGNSTSPGTNYFIPSALACGRIINHFPNTVLKKISKFFGRR